ncbi:hypothetical protein [Modestobacter lacusdianchii]
MGAPPTATTPLEDPTAADGSTAPDGETTGTAGTDDETTQDDALDALASGGQAPSGQVPAQQAAQEQAAEAQTAEDELTHVESDGNGPNPDQSARNQSTGDRSTGDESVQDAQEAASGLSAQADASAVQPRDRSNRSPAGSTSAATPRGRLTWAPPRLDAPITVHVSDKNNNLQLRDDRDYVIDMPDASLRAANGLTISGGNDVVLIGGEIQASLRNGTARGLYLKNQTGTIHVEGLRLSGDRATEGINLDQRKGATVQLQNIAVGTVRGSYSGNHADVLQTWGGPEVLRIDRLDGSTTYQGFFLDPTKFHDDTPKHFDFRNIVLRDVGRTSAYLMWQSGDFPITTQNVTVVRNPGKAFPKYVLRSRVGSWQDVANGSSATPSPLLGKPGLGYTTPGYAS